MPKLRHSASFLTILHAESILYPLRKVESHIVPQLEEQIRLSDYVRDIFKTIPSKKGMKKAIDKKWVRVNDRPAITSDYLKGGEVIDLYQEETDFSKPLLRLKLDVVYEDEYLAIVNKPPGIVVNGNQKTTLENALPFNLKKSSELDALNHFEAAHRLDYPTSGALLIGKTRNTVVALNKLFENRKIQKTYHAVTIGPSPKKGTIQTEIKGKKAETSFICLDSLPSEKYKFVNLIELTPITGRRHQLRIHLAENGTPIMGDQQYGVKGKVIIGKGLYLHASSLAFDHPVTGDPINVTIPLPAKFRKIFKGASEEEE